MNLPYKILAALVLAAGLFGAGYYAHKPQTVTKIEERVINHRDVVTKTVTAKDGTKTVVRTDHSVVAEKVDSVVKTPPPTDPYRPNYRVGALVNPLDRSVTVEAGYRLLGNAWGIGSYGVQSHQFSVGVSFDF